MSDTASNSSASTSDTSFQQFSYCQLCKFSHNNAKSHAYSKRHQASLQKLMQKFDVKVKDVKSSIKKPCIKDQPYETEENMWCYFCECGVVKHEYEDGVVVCHGGALDHLKSFIENVSKAKADYQQQKEAFHQRHVKHIVTVEDLRKEIVQDALKEESESHFFVAHNGVRKTREEIPQTTTSGNIFTGMLPPWLQPDDETSNRKEIGPNLADYEKHLESVRKSKLPANRVGANFDRDATNSSDWLPSFGRVWNNGRRLASKQEFQRRKAKRQRTESSARQTTHAHRASGVPPNMNKYVL